MPSSAELFNGVFAAPAKVAYRLILRVGCMDNGEQLRPGQLRQFARVPAIGL